MGNCALKVKILISFTSNISFKPSLILSLKKKKKNGIKGLVNPFVPSAPFLYLLKTCTKFISKISNEYHCMTYTRHGLIVNANCPAIQFQVSIKDFRSQFVQISSFLRIYFYSQKISYTFTPGVHLKVVHT